MLLDFPHIFKNIVFEFYGVEWKNLGTTILIFDSL